MPIRLTRRSALAAAALAAAAWPRRTHAANRLFASDPFTLGVTSGCPTPQGFVLWTRLAPSPLTPTGGMDDQPVDVAWQVASDEKMQKIVARGTHRAVVEDAHTVHAEVAGLESDRWYWYRFLAGGATSRVGRARTLPAPDAKVAKLRFGYGSCQHFEHGYFAAHRHLASEELDLMIFLGDYIYELSWGEDFVRRHHTIAESRTLAAYRERYAQYRTDPDLQLLHARVPWLVTWDDHEVANDYVSLTPQDPDPSFADRRAAAYRAFWEHMPLRMSQRPSPSLRLYDRVRFGRLAEINLMDGRQYRSLQACPPPGHAGGNVVLESACPALFEPGRSFFGAEQDAWLQSGLAAASAEWNVIAQQTVLARLDRRPGEGAEVGTDGWDGYPAARRRLIEQLANPRVANPLVIGGDMHTYFVADLKTDFEKKGAPVVATEFCGTSITSQSYRQGLTDPLMIDNPHLKFAKSDRRGYVVLELGSKRALASLRSVDDVRKKDSGVSTYAAYVVESGKPGAIKA